MLFAVICIKMGKYLLYILCTVLLTGPPNNVIYMFSFPSQWLQLLSEQESNDEFLHIKTDGKDIISSVDHRPLGSTEQVKIGLK